MQRLIQRPPNGVPIMSLFLDMSVTSENKRTYQVFLQQRRLEHGELDSDRSGKHHREPLGEAFDRAEDWITTNFDQANHGIALFMEVGGDWIEGYQFPMSVTNRLDVGERPVIGPLAEMLSKNKQYGIVLVDREHCRLLSYYLSELRHHKEIRPDAYPTPHDVQKGGYAAKDYQKYKAEETRGFYRMFAQEIADLDRRHRFDYWILLGTDENVKNFREFLPAAVNDRVIHTDHAPVDAADSEVQERLAPFVGEHALHDEAAKVDVLRDRLRNNHFAIAGVRDTLEQLQEGKVDTLVISRDLNTEGAQCTRCGFYLDTRSGGCPYCGGELRNGVDLVESMIRMAASQDVTMEFVDGPPLQELKGVGALLKF